MIKYGGCPKCSGHLFVAGDMDGWHMVYLNCGFRRDISEPHTGADLCRLYGDTGYPVYKN